LGGSNDADREGFEETKRPPGRGWRAGIRARRGCCEGAADRQETGGGDGVEGVCAEGAYRERGEREMVVGQRSQD
jgi:hypothetical protein